MNKYWSYVFICSGIIASVAIMILECAFHKYKVIDETQVIKPFVK